MSCLHCLALAEQIADLKAGIELQRFVWRDNADLLAKRFQLSPHQASALNALYRANGRILTMDQLDEAMPESRDGMPRTRNHLSVHLCRIKKRLGSGAIKNHWGHGWAITDLGRILCDEALEAQARAA